MTIPEEAYLRARIVPTAYMTITNSSTKRSILLKSTINDQYGVNVYCMPPNV